MRGGGGQIGSPAQFRPLHLGLWEGRSRGNQAAAASPLHLWALESIKEGPRIG